MSTKNPQTPGEWQDAVDGAYFYSLLDSARKYGLVTGGPTVNVDRCDEILRDGASRGMTPSRDCIERYVGGRRPSNGKARG